MITASLLAGVVILFECTSLDLTVQDKFYDFQTGEWLIDRNNSLLDLFFYSGPKYLLVAFGVFCLGKVIFTPKSKQPIRDRYFKICLFLALVPLTISGIKKVSNIYTPAQTDRYGGKYLHVGLFEDYPADFTPDKPGRGWPAGHASGGFSLMGLYYFFTKKSHRIFGLSLGLAAGWITGIYQTLNGQHYISHTIVTMLLAWMLINLIELIGQLKSSKSRH
ncbi:MAG: phosphatase PAP2 family protein [Phycisphaerae bacterium]|nr:phosphatase PAP2 family protein [Phycisphaerae bacterium]